MGSEQERTLYVGNLAPEVTELLLYELFLQMGPVKSVRMPRDKTSGESQGFGFVLFYRQATLEYTLKVLQGINLFDRSLKIGKVNGRENTDNDGSAVLDDFGPIVFVGNLDTLLDKQTIQETFSSFGKLIDIEMKPGLNSNWALVMFETFESADKAIEAMKGRMIMNKPVKVEYALIKGGKERHGNETERFLWEKASQSHYLEEVVQSKLEAMKKKDNDKSSSTAPALPTSLKENGDKITSSSITSAATSTPTPTATYHQSHFNKSVPNQRLQSHSPQPSNPDSRQSSQYNNYRAPRHGSPNAGYQPNDYSYTQRNNYQPYPQQQGPGNRRDYKRGGNIRGNYQPRGGYQSRGRGRGRGGYGGYR
ncbi:U2 snRNP complex subunit [Martiniozyma asiatica (nom. inval.)]|nr:U2 snRNP complex subunit [Martiniozyma asiatica]